MVKRRTDQTDLERARQALPGRAYYSVADAARVLGVSSSSIWRWIESGRLPAARVGPKSIRISREALQAVVTPARAPWEEVHTTSEEPIRSQAPSPEEVARRQAVVKQILTKRDQRVIAPLTSADLVHRVRRQEGRAHGGGH